MDVAAVLLSNNPGDVVYRQDAYPLHQDCQRLWAYRNKYYLLAELFYEHKFLQVGDRNLDGLFFKGLDMSLRQPKSCCCKRDTTSYLTNFIFGSLLEKKTMSEHWCCL